jgi:hypothetical protein
MTQKLIPQRTEKEPYTITEAQKDAARKRRKYGQPKAPKAAKK